MPAEFNDDEPTQPRAAHFRCTTCLAETLDRPSARAPLCTKCNRYMAPVNQPRGQA